MEKPEQPCTVCQLLWVIAGASARVSRAFHWLIWICLPGEGSAVLEVQPVGPKPVAREAIRSRLKEDDAVIVVKAKYELGRMSC